jgi:hypothetical protein
METLENRVATLERENRRLKSCALLALVVVAGVILTGQASVPNVSDQITTRRLVVVDEAGQTRAVLSGAGFVLDGEPGEGVASLIVGKNGPTLMLGRESEKPQILLTVLTDGPHLELLDKTLETRVSIVAGKEASGLTLFSEAGTAQAALAVLKNGPTLAMYDEAKAQRCLAGKGRRPC